MTDYAEEQRNELEAIESIYPDSFTGLNLSVIEKWQTASSQANK